MNNEDRLFIRSLAGFVIAFATSVSLFAFFFKYDGWLHGGFISIPEPKRTQDSWVEQWSFSIIIGMAGFVPSIICYIIGIIIGKIIGTRSVLYYISSIGFAAVSIFLCFYLFGYYWGGFEGEEGYTQADMMRIGWLCASSFASGALAGFIYWIFAIMEWKRS